MLKVWRSAGLNRLARALALVMTMIAGFITIYGLSDKVSPCDVAIVFGSGVRDDGIPTFSMIARLDRAIALYHQETFRHIIVSGGDEKNGFNEAHVMRAYLVKHDIPADAVIMEDKSLTTWENAKFSAPIMRAQGWHSAMVVSEFFHIYRCRWFLAAQGITPIFTASAVSYNLHTFYMVVREVAAVVRYSVWAPR